MVSTSITDLRIAETIFAQGEQRLARLQATYGGYWRFPSLLDFCYLVNPYYPTPKMVEELRARFDTLLREYPSGMGVNALLAGKYFGLDSRFICPGNGAAELIKSLMENIFDNATIGIVEPTFEEYPNRRGRVDTVAFRPEAPDFAYTADDLMAYFSLHPVDALLLINPDNPSGNFIPRPDIFRLARWAEERGVRLIVDESFVDFARRPRRVSNPSRSSSRTRLAEAGRKPSARPPDDTASQTGTSYNWRILDSLG